MKPLSSIRCTLRYNGRLPEDVEVTPGHVRGILGRERAGVVRWREHPHVRLANLSTGDAKAMAAFIKTYGALSAPMPEEAQTDEFNENAHSYAKTQDRLRRAWSGDRQAIWEIKTLETIRGREFSVSGVEVELATEDLWSFLCLLFLRDHAAGRTKVCANPGCPARYYLARRKDQKFCVRGVCTAYAQRQYTLKWWRNKGQDRRAKLRQRKRRTKQ